MTDTTLALYETMAEALFDAYRTGTPDAMARHYRYTWHRRAWQGMRRYVQLDLGKRRASADDDVPITLDDARFLVATEYGFGNWESLRAFAESGHLPPRLAAKPVRLVDSGAPEISQTLLTTRDWDEALGRLAERPSARLSAQGQMTDAIMADVARIEGLTELDLSGSQGLTDDGIRPLAKLSRLRVLDLSKTNVTDRGLRVLGELPSLESLSLSLTRITDDGAANLAACDALVRVNLAWTPSGDGALRALAGKPELRSVYTGNGVTDAGLPLLHEIPAFKTWRGEEPEMALFTDSGNPNNLWLRGRFTDRGMEQLRGLDGLFDLNLDDSGLAITAAAMAPLVSLARLGRLSVDAKDDWMPYLAAMPRLRFLLVQDTTASDDGFVTLSRSKSIELLWGRRCHNLGTRGFLALGGMPALKNLAVSCANVEDRGVAALPSFPSLRELMPMDVPDAGYRHIGKCERLESLILMYCGDTTDAATEHITGLRHLTNYYNSYTSISDRTPELLSTLDSLERVTFDACHGLTNTGVARLARLPRLRELRVAGRGVTAALADAFPASVSVAVGG
jgi:Leucine-rich repeat (LRR) protein